MKERVKSWTLSILISISVFLTWQLWNYQPNYALLDETGYVPSESLGEELSLKEIIRPQQLVFHQGNTHRSVDGSDKLLSVFYEDLLETRFENFTLNQNVDKDSVYEGNLAAELIFPASIPGEALEQILDIESETPYLSIDSVDKIVLSNDEVENGNLKVKFISYKERVVLEGETNFSEADFIDSYVLKSHRFPKVFPYEIPGNDFIPNYIYLPEKAMKYSYLSDTMTALNYNDFLNLLFSDSDYVRQYRQDNDEASFTDGNRMMSLEDNGDYLTYVNPVYSESPGNNQQHVVTTSFDFVNSRGGWTDKYQLYEWQQKRGEESATYRMIVGGLPVFESRGRDLASINVERAGGQVTEFSRPLFNLDESPIDTQGSVELASGYEILEYVESQFDPELIENIKVGYKMEKTDNLVIRFEPSWYVKYDGAWYSAEPGVEEE